MDLEIKKDVLELSDKLVRALKNYDALKLGEIFNENINDFHISQESTLVTLSLITYSLKKLIERQKTKKYENWDNSISNILEHFNIFSSQVRKDDKKGYSRTLKKIINLIENLDENLFMYFEEILDKSKLKKGYKLFEHGISLGRASEIIGISRWDLMNYIGKTNLIDEDIGVNMTKNKIKIVKEIFNIK